VSPSTAVLVPVKAFGAAKARLSGALDDASRAALSRSMAERVVAAAGSMPVWVACDDESVAAWAASLGAHVIATHGLDLNGSVARGLATLAALAADDGGGGVRSAVIAHADLPFAEDLERVCWFGGHARHGAAATIVPDRHDDGTNVLHVPLHVPLDAPFVPSYGPGSFARHLAQLRRLGLAVHVARLADLQWDVDVPDDLPAVGAR
jgi:2-phospho-L-lactate guanylyltransferase